VLHLNGCPETAYRFLICYLKDKSQLSNETESCCDSKHFQFSVIQLSYYVLVVLGTVCCQDLSGQLSFLLRVSSDALPTEVNLYRWKTQCSAQCALCDSMHPTTAHILSGYPVALAQNKCTYWHNLALQ